MRQFPAWMWLILAVGVGVLASLMALGWLKRQAATTPPVQTRSLPVVVAKVEVGSAGLLTAAQLTTDVWHQQNLPKGSFNKVEEVVGRVAATSLAPGELITEAKLAPKGSLSGITALLGPNQRAMTVKVDEASGVAGFLVPGDRVDVVVTVDKGEFGKDPVARVLFQNLKILGTGQKMEYRPGDKPQIVPTVTLEVSPEVGERLALAAQEGRISLVLRRPGDQQLVQTTGVDASELFGKPKKATREPDAVATAPPLNPTVEVIRGLERQPVNF
jgi:pilus assembly protein CpaB